MNDKDIRKFIKENGIKVHDSEKFMNEVRRQIELLPTQSAMDENERNFMLIKAIFNAEEKFNKRNAIFTTVTNLLIMIAFALILLYFLPAAGLNGAAISFVVKYNYLVFAGLSLLLTIASLPSLIRHL